MPVHPGPERTATDVVPRGRWLLPLLCALAAASAAEPVAGGEEHAFFPLRTGSRLSFVARSSRDEETALHWEVSYLRGTPRETGGVRVMLKSVANGWYHGRVLQREERYVREPRGVFTLLPDQDAAADGGDLEPRAMLPPEQDMEQVDAVWRYEGHRPLPLSLQLLGLWTANQTPVPTTGTYHVLSIGPVDTDAGHFDQAVEVTGIERVEVFLRPTQHTDVLLRCRRWYVAGVGQVKELLELLEYPQLGLLSTELTSYTGLTVRPLDAPPVGDGVAQGQPADDDEGDQNGAG